MAGNVRVATILVDGHSAGAVDLLEKTFKTGSKGYYANGKIVIDGKKFQVGGNFVEIGSKPKA